MRIISGFLKGKKIEFLKSTITRPLRDFVKESTFNVIKHSKLINVPLENANILDLYSGVGSFGIECISRGAKRTTFVEKDRNALEILKKNIEQLKIKEKSYIFEVKIISFFNQLNKNNKYEIIFFDPPFSDKFFIDELKSIRDKKIYDENHLIILHRESGTNDEINNFLQTIITKDYGKSKITFGKFF